MSATSDAISRTEISSDSTTARLPDAGIAVGYIKRFMTVNLPKRRWGVTKTLKILYYLQGLHLVLFDMPLFPNAVEAFEKGPVVRSVWETYDSIQESELNDDALVYFIDAILGVYRYIALDTLIYRLHEHPCWKVNWHSTSLPRFMPPASTKADFLFISRAKAGLIAKADLLPNATLVNVECDIDDIVISFACGLFAKSHNQFLTDDFIDEHKNNAKGMKVSIAEYSREMVKFWMYAYGNKTK